MSPKYYFGAVFCCAAMTPAWASSQVAMYGLIDIGLSYINDIHGRSHKAVEPNTGLVSRIGFRGREELNADLAAVFTLESGFEPDTGKSKAVFFDREATVGLESKNWGTLRLGRQLDLISSPDGVPDSAPLVQGGISAGYQAFLRPTGTPVPIDVHYGGIRYNNAIKYTKKFSNITAGWMYGYEGASGNNQRVASGLVKYQSGGFAIAAAYTRDNFSVAPLSQKVWAIKSMYETGPWGFYLNHGRSKDVNSLARLKLFEAVVMYKLSPTWRVGGGLGYAPIRVENGQKTKIYQPFVGGKYALSKRSDIYLIAASNRVKDHHLVAATFGVPGGAGPGGIASGDTMNTLRVGVTHRF